jgi:hypothetical protein
MQGEDRPDIGGRRRRLTENYGSSRGAKIGADPDAAPGVTFDHGSPMTRLEANREHRQTKRRPSVTTLPPARGATIPKRMFLVRCTSCGRRFEVDCAPATCPSCGEIAVAG